MKLAAVAIDYDGTIAVNGVFDTSVREAIAQLRLHGIAVVLVTGRRLVELKSVAGNLGCFNAIVAANGAVLYFPESGRQGYCLCNIDPEGDYQSLEALPGVVMMGGDYPPPSARELTQALRYPDTSVVIDLSTLSHQAKEHYVREFLPLLAKLRRQTGLPHRILLDEAHYYLAGPEGRRLVDAELAGYTLVTYRVSGIDEQVRTAADTVVIVTRGTDPQEQDTLRAICEAAGGNVPNAVFHDLSPSEAALLPGAEESHGRVQRFQIAPRLTSHVRHRAKYLDMPVPEPHAFVFTHNGGRWQARSLKDFVDQLAQLPDNEVIPYLRRHDFSRWLEHVFRDCPLATHVQSIENRVSTDRTRDLANDISQAVRARYEMTPVAL